MNIAERLHQMMLRPGFQAREDQETLLKGKQEIERLRRALHDASLNLTVLIEAAKSAGNPGLAESVSKFRSEIDAALS